MKNSSRDRALAPSAWIRDDDGFVFVMVFVMLVLHLHSSGISHQSKKALSVLLQTLMVGLACDSLSGL